MSKPRSQEQWAGISRQEAFVQTRVPPTEIDIRDGVDALDHRHPRGYITTTLFEGFARYGSQSMRIALVLQTSSGESISGATGCRRQERLQERERRIAAVPEYSEPSTMVVADINYARCMAAR